METPQQWQVWAQAGPSVAPIDVIGEPGVRQMAPLLRRRAGQLGKMALEVAYACLAGQRDVPLVFSSRHGEVARAVELLSALAQGEPLSPTAFGMAVHNASAGLFSIARADTANQLAIAAGAASLEAAVIEACALLADGAPQVLLVLAECPLPAPFEVFEDCHEQPHAFAWLLQAESSPDKGFSLTWRTRGSDDALPAAAAAVPASLAVQRFMLSGARTFEHVANRQVWCWSRHA
ncbi:beta-ketoacyl synthase chain length factor [Janthinobacterium sp. GW458P]|uniref:beta-ketoacyl synthase chain length factor n=1 Tax=Janthinobacterium sp. GW458P TaxID=1981504 RepID=UPI001D011351|nr:beta-ketoacyl synthase chain length factor [Janthinobacterium sp. GW458P]